MKINRSFVTAAALAAFAGLAAAQPTVWNFNDTLNPTSGPGSLEARPAQTSSFGTASSFGLPLIGGSDAGVLKTDFVDSPDAGYNVHHMTGPNGGGGYGNQYTFIADVLFPTTNGFHSFYNTNETNANDGDFFLNPNGGIGISGSYQGNIQANNWYRVAFTVDLTATPSLKKYIDGVLVGSQNIGGRDGRFALYTTAQAPIDYFILFGDNDGDTLEVFTNSFLFENRVWSEGEMAALGAATAAGIVPPASLPPSVSATIAPSFGSRGSSALLTATPASGTLPASTSYTLTADLSALGGSSTQSLFDNGTNGDAVANDGVYSYLLTVGSSAPTGANGVSVTVLDQANRTGTGTASFFVLDPTSGCNFTVVNFDNATAPLASDAGPGQLEFWDAVTPGNTETITQFGTTTSFGIPNIAGASANVMHIPSYFADEGLRFNNLSPGNGGGVYVNQVSFGYDIYFPSNCTDCTDSFPFLNSNNTNSNPADFLGVLSTGQLGLDYNKRGDTTYSAPGAFTLDSWNRIVFVLDVTADHALGHIYVNGAPVFTGPINDSVDTYFSLYSTTDGDPAPDTEAFSHICTSGDGFSAEAYINSFFMVDRALSASDVAGMGSASASGFPVLAGSCAPTPCDPDVNQDGNADQGDIDYLVNVVAGGDNPTGVDPDFNTDGNADQGDVDALINVIAGGACP
ncbi:MAG: choice-of-anchor X domain-containing protein [Phycisphaerales bacterium]|jgi:hypothetical protein